MASATAITSAKANAPATAKPSSQAVMRRSQRSHGGRREEGAGGGEPADLCVTGGGISLRMEKAHHYKKWGQVFEGVEK